MPAGKKLTLAILLYMFSVGAFTYGLTRYFVTRKLVATQIRAYREWDEAETRSYFERNPDATSYTLSEPAVQLRKVLVFSGSPYRFWYWMLLCFAAGAGAAGVGFRFHWLANEELGWKCRAFKAVVDGRWKWVAGLEVVGMCIVCFGLLWYAMFAESPTSPFTARNVGEYSHPREIAGAIITPGGMILALGYFGILAGSAIGQFSETEPSCQQAAGRQQAPVVALSRYLLLPVPFSLPFVVEFLYQPINEHVTVERFGCGCYFGFNANSINFILWLQVLAMSTAMWLSLAKWMLSRHLTAMPDVVFAKRLGLFIMAVGSFALAYLVLQRYGRSYWM